MKTESMLSAGIDIGTTTTHLVISRIGIGVTEGFGTVPSVHITSKKVLFKSDVVFTPLLPDGKIDASAVTAIIKEQYKKAGVTPDELKCGAVIVTGESACRENASEVISSVSEFAGDFIAAQAGSELESYLSGKGAGADVISENEGKCTANVDIGGGTTNISVFVNGSCVETCCLNIGGRLVRKSNDDGIFISSSLLNMCRANGINIKSFDDADSINSIHKLCSILASKIKEALGFCKEKNIETELITDSLLSGKYIPEIVTFSGGVSECMQEKTDNLFKYGDIGVILADEIRNDTETYPCKVITELDNPIRATVIGAGQFSMDISGSTIQYADVALPIKNLPCIESLERVSDKACAICIRGEKSPSFKDVDTLSEKIVTACKELINNNTTLVVILKEDFSKALGQCLRRRLPPKYPFICLDGIECKSDDYIDIGEPIAGNKAVPVVVKTLVFGGKKK